jgi:hypothetical protein
MFAARQRLIDVRTDRTAHLMRLRDYLRNALKEFASNTDPVSGARFAEVATDGSKSRGDLAITVTFFEGTKVSLGIDTHGRYVHSASPPSVLGDIGTIAAIRVCDDLSRAQITYDTNATPTRRRTIDVSALLDAVTEAAVRSVESEVCEEPAGVPDPDRAMPNVAPQSVAAFAKPAPVAAIERGEPLLNLLV